MSEASNTASVRRSHRPRRYVAKRDFEYVGEHFWIQWKAGDSFYWFSMPVMRWPEEFEEERG